MSWSQACLGFVRKYGTAARGVASAVLNVVAPGSAALVGLVGTACEAAQEAAEGHFEERLRQSVQNNHAEVVRVLRGGGWSSDAGCCGSADRVNNDPRFRNANRGCRLALSLKPR